MPSTSERPWLHEAPQYGLRMLAAVDPDNPAVLRFAAPAEALPEDTRVSVLWPDSWGGRDGTTGAGWRLEARECGSGDLAAFAEGRGTAPQLELRLPAGGNGSKLWRCALLPCGATDVGEAAAVLHVHGAPSERRVTWMALTTLEPPPISEAAAALVPAFSDAQRFEAEYASLLPPALRSRDFGVGVGPPALPHLPAAHRSHFPLYGIPDLPHPVRKLWSATLELELLVVPPDRTEHFTKTSELRAAIAAAGLAARGSSSGRWRGAVNQLKWMS